MSEGLSGACFDPDDGPVTFSNLRRQSDGSTIGWADLSSGTAPDVGTRNLRFTVTDDEGQTRAFDITLDIRNSAPQYEGTLENQSLKTGETLSVRGENHFSDPNGHDLTFRPSVLKPRPQRVVGVQVEPSSVSRSNSV